MPPPQARATLGEGAASITRDRNALSAAKKATTSHASYTVQEVASDATTVREYLNLSGVVFAVAWNGMTHPDLTTLLGSYAGEYRDAKRRIQRQHGQKRSRVEANRVIVETWGHMRNLRGRAYLPALLPEGVSANEIN
jgi:hypothetical protein